MLERAFEIPRWQKILLLSTPEATALEEGELQHLEGQVEVPDFNLRLLEQVVVSNIELLMEGEPLQHTSPEGAKVSPSYVDITRKKQDVFSDSSDEDSIEQLSKNDGKKSKKETREEEVERLKMQGNQSTIEISYDRSKRSRPANGVITPS